MFKKDYISLSTFIDFSYMFFSTLIKKGFGFIRELVLAFFFGSSIIYANYLLLKTVPDFISQITLGNALQANIMPKFVKLYEKYKILNLNNVYDFSKVFSLKLFVLIQFLQISLILFLSPENIILYLIVSIILSFISSLNFFNAIFMTILQAKGDFKKFSIATTSNISISTILLYPLILLFNIISYSTSIIGVVISRIIGVLSLAFLYVKPLIKEKGKHSVSLTFKDFNFSILILGNITHIIMLLGRLVAGLDGGNNIVFYTYAVIIINIFFTSIVVNINTLLLKFISVKKNINVVLVSTLLTAILGGLFIYFILYFSKELIEIIFQRGSFTYADTIATSNYLKDLSWSFILIFISSSLFQTYFTLPENYLKRNTPKLIFPLFFTIIILLCFFLLNNYTAKLNSIIMIYSLSSLSFVLSVLAFLKYLRYESK